MAKPIFAPCTVALACLRLAALAAGESTVLDDMGANDIQDMSQNTLFEGTYQPCLADAYNGQFKHDWARNKGQSHITYRFEPPQDGCYKIEEYHPGSLSSCSQHLPSNAKLLLEYCRGQNVHLRMDQSASGGQWNEIGLFPFFKGHPGLLTMTSSTDEQCRSTCFFVADAFRFTRVGPACRPSLTGDGVQVDNAAVAAERQRQPAAAGTPEAEPKTTTKAEPITVTNPKGGSVESHGTLRVTARVLDSDLNVRAQLMRHRGALEAALSFTLGDAEVSIKGVEAAGDEDGRRLASAPVGTFEAGFVARANGPLDDALLGEPTRLREVLQAQLDRANARLAVVAAAISWEEEGYNFTWIVVVVALTLLLVGLGVAAAVIHRTRTRSPTTPKSTVEKTMSAVGPEIVMGHPVKEVDDMKAAEKEEVRDDASTATPGSEKSNLDARAECAADSVSEASSEGRKASLSNLRELVVN